MGQQIIKQPNGLYAVWSTIVDDFIMIDALPEDIIKDRVRTETKRITEKVNQIINQLENGEAPYYQFTQTFQEAVDWIVHVHGKNAKTLKMLRKMGYIDDNNKEINQ